LTKKSEQEVKVMESIDDLLAQIRNEYENPKSQPKEQSLLAEELKLAESSTYQAQPLNQIQNSPIEDSLLAEIKAEFEEQQRIEASNKQKQLREETLRKEQQLQAEKIRIQQQERIKRDALTKEAEAWLKALNFRSEEGLWFEEFAYAYPSKLEAAIDYLQALQETNP
jgi:hypothetical protein